MSLILVIHNIRSAYNVGAILRTADAVGVEKVVISGYSPTPIDKFNRERPDIAKAALGAQTSVLWVYSKNIMRELQNLQGAGYTIVGLEQDTRSQNIFDYKPGNKIVLVLGNEVRGMSYGMRKKCDALVDIPMRGTKESLNVSVAAGIAMYALSR